MDISKLSTQFTTVNMQSQASIAVLNKTLNESQQLGQGMVDMINKSAPISLDPTVGQNFDVRV